VRIALDATYSVDPHPSGIAIYSRELLLGLARLFPQNQFLHYYRVKQFKNASAPESPNVRRRLLLPPVPAFGADLFHALNQRVDRRPAPKVVSTFHDLFVMTGEYSSPDFRARFTRQARRAAQNSDFIVAVSEFTANQVRELLGFDASRIRVVPHGVNAPIPEKFSAREEVILFVGALQKRKNVARLVKAFESQPAPWRLALAGSPSGYGAESILKQIEASPCRDRIQVTGYLSQAELNDWYARASIFAFPSLDEGFGIPVLEAMAHGVPVITSNRSALPEIAGDAAVLINPEQTEELGEALRRLIHDAELRARLSERGLERAKLYPWERAVRETYSVYCELLGSAYCF